MSETKYGQHVIKIPTGPTIWAAGANMMNGFNCHIIYASWNQTGITGKSTKPHIHKYDEAIFFLGTDPNNLAYLGAEMEMSIGPEGEEEKHVFSEPTVVVMPKGVWHCPMYTHKIERPVIVMAVSLTGERED
jgi:hypothetical protein